jgi:hypothetical protein
MSFANMSLEQMEAHLAKSKAEQKQERAEKRAKRKIATPVTSSDWSKHHNESSGITYHVHNPSGGKVFNNLTGSYKWEIRGTSSNGQIYKSLQEAKNHIETEHAKGQQ